MFSIDLTALEEEANGYIIKQRVMRADFLYVWLERERNQWRSRTAGGGAGGPPRGMRKNLDDLELQSGPEITGTPRKNGLKQLFILAHICSS